MKKQVSLYFLFFIFLIYLSKNSYFAPCSNPILYKIGTIDEKFKTNKEKLISDTKLAEKVWEDKVNKNIFDYDENGLLTINFIYDERQSLKSQIDKLDVGLKKDESSLESQIKSYENLVGEFNKKNLELENDINYWNSLGGAPKEEYDKLIVRQEEIKKDAESLNKIADNLNLQNKSYNSGVLKLNKTISDLNRELFIKPEEGIYISATNTINIYFITDRNELVHTLAHELGHARSLSHIDDPMAIMYPKTSEIVIASKDDINAMESICKSKSYFDLGKEFILNLKNIYVF